MLGFGVSVLIQHRAVSALCMCGVGDYCIADAALLLALAGTLSASLARRLLFCHHAPRRYVLALDAWWIGAVPILFAEIADVLLGVEDINSAVALRALAFVRLLFFHRSVGLSVLLWSPFLQSRHAVYVRLYTGCVHEQYGNGH